MVDFRVKKYQHRGVPNSPQATPPDTQQDPVEATINRRDFLAATALAAAFTRNSAAGAPDDGPEGWFSRPMR
ncbi:MAG: hypothetical protein ACLPYS_10210, partial [Vulcanimicrobiaceae bacterium]